MIFFVILLIFMHIMAFFVYNSPKSILFLPLSVHIIFNFVQIKLFFVESVSQNVEEANITNKKVRHCSAYLGYLLTGSW